MRAQYHDFIRFLAPANFTNRSLVIDSECDLGLESVRDGDDVEGAIRGLREALLAEHLGSSLGEFRANLGASRSRCHPAAGTRPVFHTARSRQLHVGRGRAPPPAQAAEAGPRH